MVKLLDCEIASAVSELPLDDKGRFRCVKPFEWQSFGFAIRVVPRKFSFRPVLWRGEAFFLF